MSPRREPGLAERRAAEVDAVRDAVLYQGLRRFPPDGRGPKGIDRYRVQEGETVLQALRRLRLGAGR